MKRREFIILAGGASAWPIIARAQQANAESDPIAQSLTANVHSLEATSIGALEATELEFLN